MDKSLEQRLEHLEEKLNDLKLMAESNLHDMNDSLISNMMINSEKSEDIQQEVDEIHDEILELKANGNLYKVILY